MSLFMHHGSRWNSLLVGSANSVFCYCALQHHPGAPTYSFDFLRQHPEISIESIPQHVHTDLPYEAKPAYAGAQ